MIPLYVNKGVAYVWNADDWFTLRTTHRICGALIGSLPPFPRQNDFQGLPMALMSVEAAFLVEKGICELIELPNINDELSPAQKQQIKKMEEGIFKDQSKAMHKKRVDQMSQKIDIIVAGKVQKLKAKGKTDLEIDKEALLKEEISKLPILSPNYALVHLPTEHYIDTVKRKVQINILQPSILDQVGSIHYAIYKDLWEKGHYITNGLNFGSEFLVYPGDPVKFHASYMVRCINNSKQCFQPPSLVAFGRLSVAVNKMAVLAYCSDYELEKIRQQRLAQLQAQHGGGDPNQAKAQEERMRAMEETKHSILAQALTQDARARLNTIKLSKPEKGAMVENMICRMAQMGQVNTRISENELIQLLESVNQQMPKSASTVKFDRRRAALDSDDEGF